MRLDPDTIIARAKVRTGLSDLGEQPYPDGLAVACRSLEEDANLSLLGRLALREHLVLAVESCLRRVSLRITHPEVFEAELERPIVVLGLPRSGTTFLHRLLCELPGNRGLRTWEIRRPFLEANTGDERRRQAERALTVLRAMAPGLDAKHRLDADEVEEGVGLFDGSFWTPSMWRLAAVHGYLDWYLAQDPLPGYRIYRDALAWLAHTGGGGRLVLKLPNHVGFVHALAEVLPNACFVQTHREPGPVIASYNSLMNSVHGAFASEVDAERAGKRALLMWAELLARGRRERETLASGRVLDVSYAALVAEPMATVRELYEHFEIPWPPEAEQALADALTQRPQHKHGRHVYALGDCGITEAAVAHAFDHPPHSAAAVDC